MEDVLLLAKLQRPPLRTSDVARPRLIARLDEALPQAGAWQRALTLVSAPAGYGKTTLLCQWLDGCGHPAAWLSLDEADNDPARFLSYLVTALQQIEADLGIGSLDALRPSGVPSAGAPPPLELALTLLLNEIASIDHPFILVLDDYHLIEASAVHGVVSFLLDNQPAQMHLVIATRVDPPLPVARLRAQARLAELHTADLCFTDEEAGAFLNHTMELALPGEEVAALERRTEGWIAGLQLAALSMQDYDRRRRSDFIAEFSGGHHYIVDYLIDEVLAGQPGPVRDFLLQTCLLEKMTGPLCDALTGRTDGQAMLEALERRNLFLIPLDENRRWYRYHHLFATVLQGRLRHFHPDWITGLRRRAVEWHEANGFVMEAVSQAMAAGDEEKVAQLIERDAVSMLMGMLMRGELKLLLSWIAAIEPVARRHPWLSIFESWALTLTGQWESIESWLREAERCIAESVVDDARQMRGHVAAIRAYGSAVRGEVVEAIHFAEQALDFLPADDQAVRSVVTMTLGSARRLTGDLAGADRALEEAARTGRAAGNTYLALGALSSRADLLFTEGRLHRSSAAYDEMLQLATQPSGRPLPAAGMAYFGQSIIYYEWNELETAEDHAELAVQLCRQWGNIATLTGSYVMLFRVWLAQGEADRAQEALREAERLAHTHAIAPRAAAWVTAFQVRWWLAQGNLQAAAQWADRCGLQIDDDISYLREIEYMALGRVFLALANYGEALTLVKRLLQSAQDAGRLGSVIELLALKACVLQARGEVPQALSVLESACSLAEPEGFVRTFLDEGQPMAQLLRQALTEGIAAGYTASLLAAFDEGAAAAPLEARALVEPLSDRELQVLQLIAAGLSNREIAEELVIAISTVKSHINNTYGKLGVSRRTQAIARAQELGLL